MAFLDNSGDIILDAVLTDTGRMRLAKGDGSFRITKFALGDDEINYALYDASAVDGQRDLQIMETPILEAFTNNASSMKSRLMTLANNPGLYLPVLRLNTQTATNKRNALYNTFVCAVDAQTQGSSVTSGDINSFWHSAGESDNMEAGVLPGADPTQDGVWAMVDQGIDTQKLSAAYDISAELYESQYLIEMDSRLAQLVSSDGNTLAAVSFVDDDQIASYYLSQAVNGAFIITNPGAGDPGYSGQIIEGPRGSRLTFGLKSSLTLQTSTGLFTQLGSTVTLSGTGTPKVFLYIDSNIRVTGVTTGSRIDIPVRFIKYSSG